MGFLNRIFGAGKQADKTEQTQRMKLKSISELETLFSDYKSNSEIKLDSFRKTRYIDSRTFDNLVSYELDFAPYNEIAKRCSMGSFFIMRSTRTNRFYIGFLNLGGHGPVYEIRPVRLPDVKDYEYMEKMFANHAQQLDWGVDIKEDYKV